METIEIFTGNRAEFGILSSLIEELCELYKINLIVSGAHLLNKWQTKDEIINKINEFKNSQSINIIELPVSKLPSNHTFAHLLPVISSEYLKYRSEKENKIKFCLFLGDRIETAAYATTAMYLENVLVHICGGDIGDMAHFDHNIRHALTKISHLHLVTNDQSFKVVEQLGEENWRIKNIGMPSLDVASKKSIISKNELKQKFNLETDNLIIATYHPDHYSFRKESLSNFKEMISALSNQNHQVILTYPNNDPGFEELINEIETNVKTLSNINVVKNLGINNYISLLKQLNVVLIGNTSSIVLESGFFKTPSLLLGKRQHNRYRGKNVTEMLEFSSNDIIQFVNQAFNRYEELKQEFESTRYIYGKGQSAIQTTNFLKEIFEKFTEKQILSKGFIIK